MAEWYLNFGAGSVKWGPIFKEKEDEVERVRSLLSETEREYRHLVMQKNLLEFGLFAREEAQRWLWILMRPRRRGD
ncbi:unnamed protein product [Prunus armeniaca]